MSLSKKVAERYMEKQASSSLDISQLNGKMDRSFLVGVEYLLSQYRGYFLSAIKDELIEKLKSIGEIVDHGTDNSFYIDNLKRTYIGLDGFRVERVHVLLGINAETFQMDVSLIVVAPKKTSKIKNKEKLVYSQSKFLGVKSAVLECYQAILSVLVGR